MTTIYREDVDAVYRNSFGAFVYRAFEILNPGRKLDHNWHIDCICYLLEQMEEGRSNNHLVLNLPPRTLKTFIVSICFVAWLLGRNPTLRIICASYSEDLSNKLSRDCRALMETKFYKRVFSHTRLNPKKANEGEFETTRRGFRLATWVGGTLTGRGGDIIIIDDPIKSDDVRSEVALKGTTDWFNNTVISRTDNPSKGLIIVTMQRLHDADLSGMLIEGGWPKLVIPAIATEPADYVVATGEIYHRAAGELLQPSRDRIETLEYLKRQVGSRVFAAQYQQDPMPLEGNLIRTDWLARYLSCSDVQFQRVVISVDPAGKAGPENDYTALVVAGIKRNDVYILEVVRGHWTVLPMMQKIIAQVRRWNADLVMIEDTASGTSLIEMLREQSNLNVIGRLPKGGKVERMERQLGKFEAGRVLLPTEAAWLAELEKELLSFPNGKYDDQVDALMQILEWWSPHRSFNEVDLGRPVQAKDSNDYNSVSVIDTWSPDSFY